MTLVLITVNSWLCWEEERETSWYNHLLCSALGFQWVSDLTVSSPVSNLLSDNILNMELVTCGGPWTVLSDHLITLSPCHTVTLSNVILASPSVLYNAMAFLYWLEVGRGRAGHCWTTPLHLHPRKFLISLIVHQSLHRDDNTNIQGNSLKGKLRKCQDLTVWVQWSRDLSLIQGVAFTDD